MAVQKGCNLAVVHQVAAEAGKLDTAVAGLGADIQDRVAKILQRLDYLL